jgi:hypothetical protein
VKAELSCIEQVLDGHDLHRRYEEYYWSQTGCLFGDVLGSNLLQLQSGFLYAPYQLMLYG